MMKQFSGMMGGGGKASKKNAMKQLKGLGGGKGLKFPFK